jgi:hypothetical protein
MRHIKLLVCQFLQLDDQILDWRIRETTQTIRPLDVGFTKTIGCHTPLKSIFHAKRGIVGEIKHITQFLLIQLSCGTKFVYPNAQSTNYHICNQNSKEWHPSHKYLKIIYIQIPKCVHV